MIAWLISWGRWNWFILAALLLLLEVLLPGTFMLWLGLAAIAVGLLSLAIDWGWQAQVMSFAVLAMAAIPAWRYFARRVEAPSDHPALNRRAQNFVGRVFALDEPIANGVGRVRIDDSVWRVMGEDRPAGARVRVVRADGAVLFVEPTPETSSPIADAAATTR